MKFEITLYRRIRSLRDIPSIGVKAGDIGGNFDPHSCDPSCEGDWWVFTKAIVNSDTDIRDNVLVSGASYVSGRGLTLEGNLVVSNTYMIAGGIFGGHVLMFGLFDPNFRYRSYTEYEILAFDHS